MSPFIVQHDQVLWITHYGPAPLDPKNIEGLLDLFADIGGAAGRKLWLELEEAASGTSWFIKRPRIWRSEARFQVIPGGIAATSVAPLPRCNQPLQFNGKGI